MREGMVGEEDRAPCCTIGDPLGVPNDGCLIK